MRRKFLTIIATAALALPASDRAHALWMDGSADRIVVGYDGDGRLQTIETRDGTTVKNGIKLTYTEPGQLEAFFQDPDGAVTESSGTPSGTTRKVVHAFDDVGITTSTAWSTTPGGNFSRLESITYPSGHVLEIGYNALSSGTSSDHFVSRVRKLDFDGTSRQVRYDFLGLATPVVVDYQGPDVQLDRTFSHDGSRQWDSYGNNPGKYPAFDAYGRLVRHAWLDGDLTKGTGSGAGYPTKPPLVEIEQAFNLASFITERFDDRPGSARNRDQQYDNDMLLRLVEATRGEMAGSTFTVKPGSERYGYDFVGNFVEFDTDRTGDGDFTDGADQTIAGTFSMVNEVEEIVVTEGGSSPDYLFEHDAAGNLSSREISSNRWIKAVHDAWGRLTKVDLKVGESTYPRARVEYNGLNMRTLVDRDDDVSDGSHALRERRLLYYSAGWQVLEEHVDTDTPLNRDSASDIDRVVQTVWGPRYIDDLILRRQNNNHAGGSDTDFTDSSVDRPGDWALTDPQFSVIALIDDAATIVERVSYDAYGQARHHRAKDVDGDGDVDSTDGSIVHAARGKSIHQSGYNADADWDRDGDVDTTDEAAFGSGHWQSAIALGQVSAVDNAFGFCAYVFNPETGWYTVRFRHYDPTTGVARWLERDPAGYVDGPSLYGYGVMAPHSGMDPMGLSLWRDFAMGWDYISDGVHLGLDGAGFIPGLGEIADGVNGLLYLAEGNWVDAAISGAAMIPLAGDVGKLARMGKKAYGAAMDAGKRALSGLTRAGREAILNGRSWRRAGTMKDLGSGATTKIGGDVSLPLHPMHQACFVAGTIVPTASGETAIEAIEPGDAVWSFDEESGAWTLALVQATSERLYEGELVEIAVAIDTGALAWVAPEPIVATAEHPFWVGEGDDLADRPAVAELAGEDGGAATGSTGGRWVEARWLRLGDRFLTRTGISATVVGLTIRTERVKVYNLSVVELQRYAVGHAGVGVHNACILDDIFESRGEILRGKHPRDFPGLIDAARAAGWTVDVLADGQDAGKGLRLLGAGDRLITWSPGTSRRYGGPYWKISSGTLGRVRIPSCR